MVKDGEALNGLQTTNLENLGLTLQDVWTVTKLVWERLTSKMLKLCRPW